MRNRDRGDESRASTAATKRVHRRKLPSVAPVTSVHVSGLGCPRGRAVDHRRTPRRGTQEGVRRRRRAAEGTPHGQRTGVHFPSAATVLRRKGRVVLHPPGTPWNNGFIDRSTTDYARSASTAITGTPCLKPWWSSATSNTNITINTATRRWATERRPSTLRHAGAPTPRWPARSTESGNKKPDSTFGWTRYRGLANSPSHSG